MPRWCSIALGHEMALLGGTSACPLDSWECQDDVLVLLATRCLYWGYICLSNALSIVSTEEINESSYLKVVLWCSNTLDCSRKDMSELVWIGNSPDSISIHLVEEYVMRSFRYTTVKSHWKVVPNIYIGLYRWFVSFACCWLMLCVLGGLSALWVLHVRGIF